MKGGNQRFMDKQNEKNINDYNDLINMEFNNFEDLKKYILDMYDKQIEIDELLKIIIFERFRPLITFNYRDEKNTQENVIFRYEIKNEKIKIVQLVSKCLDLDDIDYHK